MWAPLGVANDTGAWRPEPTTRGTWSVLSGSLTTIILCVWTTLHLNIPERGRAKLHPWMKLKWVIIGLFAPDMVCFVAWEQWRRARDHSSRMQRHLKGLEEPLPRKKRHWWCWWRHAPNIEESPASAPQDLWPRWTMRHSFYTLMGGFVFILPSGQKYHIALPNGRESVVLSTKALLFLAEHQPEMIPRLSEADISGKSKSNGISKLIGFWQAFWFGAQFITRLVMGLKVSLLELNTFLHVICAISYFCFWWKKPLDVLQPTPIQINKQTEQQICAAMCLESAHIEGLQVEKQTVSNTPGHRPRNEKRSTRTPRFVPLIEIEMEDWSRPVEEQVRSESGGGEADSSDNPNDSSPCTALQPPHDDMPTTPPRQDAMEEERVMGTEVYSPPDGIEPQQSNELRIPYGETVEDIKFTKLVPSSTMGFFARQKSDNLVVIVSTIQLEHCNLAKDGLRKFPKLGPSESRRRDIWGMSFSDEFVLQRASNWRLDVLQLEILIRYLFGTVQVLFSNLHWTTQDSTITLIGLMLSGAAYGGIHLLLGWGAPTTSTTELIIWWTAGFCLVYPVMLVFQLLVFASVIWVTQSLFSVMLPADGTPSFFTMLARIGAPASDGEIYRSEIYDKMEKWIEKAFIWIERFQFFFWTVITGLARISIVVQCYRGLEYVPSSVYDLPLWNLSKYMISNVK